MQSQELIVQLCQGSSVKHLASTRQWIWLDSKRLLLAECAQLQARQCLRPTGCIRLFKLQKAFTGSRTVPLKTSESLTTRKKALLQ
jgi:hypothetical protein